MKWIVVIAYANHCEHYYCTNQQQATEFSTNCLKYHWIAGTRIVPPLK